MNDIATLGQMIEQVFAPNLVLRLIYLALAVVIGIGLVRLVNRLTGNNFDKAFASINGNPLAAAVYHAIKFYTLFTLAGRFVAGAVLLLAVLAAAQPAKSASLYSDRYDAAIRYATDQLWPFGPDWLWWKAQLYQESRLEPNAVSPAGAQGIAQFMPATWREVMKDLRQGNAEPANAQLAIYAGAYYMVKVKMGWTPATGPPSLMELHRFAQGAYNAGGGNIRKAQRLCGDARTWAALVPCLPMATGRYSAETIAYVDRIAKWRAMLGGLPVALEETPAVYCRWPGFLEAGEPEACAAPAS